MKKQKKTKLTPTSIFDYFKEKEKVESGSKVTMAFRCDLTTQKEILRLSQEAEITPSEWLNFVVEDAIKNKVEVVKVSSVSVKYNQ